MTSEPIHITDAEFEEKVIQADLPVIVDFWAPWCGPCKMIAPVLEKIAREYAGQLVVYKVNTDENQEWMMRFNIQGIPTLFFVKDGILVHEQIGFVMEKHLIEIVEHLLAFEPAEHVHQQGHVHDHAQEHDHEHEHVH